MRLVPDTLRLCPPAIHAGVLEVVFTALLKDCALEILYENAKGERGPALIHPQAMVQRGPTPYLFALKNDETAPVRTYALHRMIRARARLDEAGRKAAGFDLDQVITSGQVDFGRGAVIDLELRVRGYAVDVLRACPITPAQFMEDEPAESPFVARVRVRVPETGALLRWLLGLGDNVEVVGPEGLRRVMGEQLVRAAGHYARLGGIGGDVGDEQGRGLMVRPWLQVDLQLCQVPGPGTPVWPCRHGPGFTAMTGECNQWLHKLAGLTS